jgi:hypothetical protein
MYNYTIDMSSHYRGNHLLVPMGCDFSFMNARQNFQSYDNLIEYFNSNYDDVTLLYSTPQTYLDALKAQDITWPSKTTDMMPYADQPNDYWSGYFTSRANSKSQIRFAQANLHASNKLYAEKVLNQEVTTEQVTEVLDANFAMLDAMGINQHHDAVTGTAKQHVSDNYAELIGTAMATSNAQYVKLIADKTKEVTGVDASQWEMCSSDNSTYRACPVDEAFEGEFYVTSHNPSTVEQTIQRVKLPPADYSVKAFN